MFFGSATRHGFQWPLAQINISSLSGEEFVPDYSADDDDEPETPAKPTPVDFEALTANAENKDEVLDRVLQLLEQQRLQRQAMVARQEADRTRANWQEDAFRQLCGSEPLKVLDLLAEVSAANILMMVDGNGLNLLHQSCRIGCVPLVERLLAMNPALADQLTSPGGRPAHWSPLMVLLDAKKERDVGRGLQVLGPLGFGQLVLGDA